MEIVSEVEKLKRDMKISQLGQCGEKIIRNMLSSQGGVYIEDSIDLYDSTKDMVVYDISVKDVDRDSITLNVNGITVEVKTQVPYISKKYLTIRTNQLTKCRNVDELYFVAVPSARYPSTLTGWIYKVDPKTFVVGEKYKKPDKYTGKDRWMYPIAINQPAVTRVRRLTEVEETELMSHSMSGK